LFLPLFFEVNGIYLTQETSSTNLYQVGNNNTGVWGRSSQPPEDNGGLGAGPPTLRRFFSFFQKVGIFRHILVYIFALKRVFKCRIKCVDALPGPAPRGTCPQLSPLLRHLLYTGTGSKTMKIQMACKFPCPICGKGVRHRKSIECTKCGNWVHKNVPQFQEVFQVKRFASMKRQDVLDQDQHKRITLDRLWTGLPTLGMCLMSNKPQLQV